jgi:hypothetical protein
MHQRLKRKMLANRLINLALVTALELNFPEMGRDGSSMGNEYTTTFQKVSAKELANRTGTLVVSAPRKGFLDLPGSKYPNFHLLETSPTNAKHCPQKFATRSTNTTSPRSPP